jgi:predicted Fe-S protein YdhL (DUF1289 family)
VYGDEICRGCKRTYDEVIDWNRFTPEQKSAVYDRLNEHAEHIVSQFFTIVAPEKLASALDDQSIRYRPDHSPPGCCNGCASPVSTNPGMSWV